MAPVLVQERFSPSQSVHCISHELRQPLSTIESAAFYLQMILGDHPDLRVESSLKKIQAAVEQAGWMLSDAESNSEAAPQLVDLMESITGILSHHGESGSVDLEWDDTGSAPLVHLDPAQARHLINTILFLFRELAEEENPIAVTFQREDQSAVLTSRCLLPRRTATAQESRRKEPDAVSNPLAERYSVQRALATIQRIATGNRGAADLMLSLDEALLRVEFPAA